MSLIVSFKGQFQEYPLPDTYRSTKLKKSSRAEGYFEELLRDHINEKEFNDILQSHKKKHEIVGQTKTSLYQSSAKKVQRSEYRFLTKAREIMTKNPECLDVNDTLATALERMYKHSHRHFPVLAEGKMIGIISDRDILLSASKGESKNKAIKELMQEKVISAREDGQIKTLIQVMLSEKIGALPVLNKQNELIGIITRSDLLVLLAKIPSIEMKA